MRAHGLGSGDARAGRGSRGRGVWKSVGLAEFERAGATVGVAWDAGKGALLVAVDGADLAPLFPDAVAPGPAVGAGLFPVLSGRGGCRVRWNLGRQAWRHEPPAGFLPWATMAQVLQRMPRAAIATPLSGR